MTLKEAIEVCGKSNLSGWELVEYAQCLVHSNMTYSYDNSFDMPFKAFEKGKGYCWQQAKSLQYILNRLGFKCYLVYATKNQIPETQFEGITVKAHTSGHVWCRVNINGIEKDVCPVNVNNKPGKIHFVPLSKVKKWNWFIGFWVYWGSAYVNHKRLMKIKAEQRLKQKQLKKVFITFFILLFFSINCFAQKKNEITVYTGFIQLKESLNQGMVYKGPQIGFDYQRNCFFDKWELRYKPKIAVGANFNRKMIGANFHFVPINFTGIAPVFQKEKHTLRVGGDFVTNYGYQFYPKQLGAHLFWFSEISISPCVEYEYQWNQSKIKVFLQNSIAGFVSHKEKLPHYFYSLTFSDFVITPHRNMKFGSFDKYEHLNATIEYIPNVSKKHSAVLGVEYMDCYYNSRFQSLNFYLQWRISF